MRKQSLAIPLTILTVIAAAGCEEQRTQQCADENGVAVSDDNCADAGTVSTDDAGQPLHNNRSGFLWYYFYGTRGVPLGSRVSGGSYSRGSDYSYSSPSGKYTSPSVGISRGGFGSTGISESSGS